MQFSVFLESTGTWYVMLQNPDGVAYADNLSAHGYTSREAAYAAIADGSAVRRIIEAAHRENDNRDRTLLSRAQQARLSPGADLSMIWKMDIAEVRRQLAALAA